MGYIMSSPTNVKGATANTLAQTFTAAPFRYEERQSLIIVLDKNPW